MKKQESLDSYIWFNGKIDRLDAEKLLKNDGDYMVRSSSSSSNFALTVRWNKSSFHFIIIKQGSKWILDDDKIKFESIPSLIEYYVKMKKQVSKLSQALLINPVNALNMQSNSRKIILPALKNKAIDLATLEAIKNEIIAMDTFRLANHIMEAELAYFQTKDDVLLPSSHQRRNEFILRDLALRYFLTCGCIIGDKTISHQVIEKLICTACELYQTLKSVPGFCMLMRLFSSDLVQHSVAFKTFKSSDFTSASVTLDHVLFPAYQSFKSNDHLFDHSADQIPDLITCYQILNSEILDEFDIDEMALILTQTRSAFRDRENRLIAIRSKLANFERSKCIQDLLSTKYHFKFLFGQSSMITLDRFGLLDKTLQCMSQ